MRITYVVMAADGGHSHPFEELSIDNSFPSEEAAEAAIERYFHTLPADLLGSTPVLWVRKQFRGD